MTSLGQQVVGMGLCLRQASVQFLLDWMATATDAIWTGLAVAALVAIYVYAAREEEKVLSAAPSERHTMPTARKRGLCFPSWRGSRLHRSLYFLASGAVGI